MRALRNNQRRTVCGRWQEPWPIRGRNDAPERRISRAAKKRSRSALARARCGSAKLTPVDCGGGDRRSTLVTFGEPGPAFRRVLPAIATARSQREAKVRSRFFSAYADLRLRPTDADARVTLPVAAKVTKKVTRLEFVQPSRRMRWVTGRFFRLSIGHCGAQAAACRTAFFPNVRNGWKADIWVHRATRICQRTEAIILPLKPADDRDDSS